MPDFINLAHQALEALNWLAVNIPWDGVFTAAIGSGILIGPQKAFKKWFQHNEVWIITLIGITGPLAVAVWTYILHNYATDPRIVALQGLALAFSTQPFYFVFWKPIVLKRVVPAVAAWWASESSKAKSLAAVKTAAVPPETAPKAALPVINDVRVPQKPAEQLSDTMKPHITSVDVQDFTK